MNRLLDFAARLAAPMRLWIAVAALLAPGLATQHGAFGRPAGPDIVAVLCAGDGPISIGISLSPDAPPTQDGAAECRHCALCGFPNAQCASPSLPATALPTPTAQANVDFAAAADASPPARAAKPYSSRAPPAAA